MCSKALSGLVLVMTLGGAAVWGLAAQENEYPVITANTIAALAPAVKIDFAMLPPEAGRVVNGRVYISSDGRRLAVINRESQVVILDDAGAVLDVTDLILTGDGFPATFIDGSFDEAGERFVALHSASNAYFVTVKTVRGDTRRVEVRSEDKPVSIWIDREVIWLEVMPSESGRFPYMVQLAVAAAQGKLDQGDLVVVPFAPAQAPESIVRVGRLPPPFAVTAAEDGRVFRWNLNTGQMTGTVHVDTLPIYGAMTPDGRFLVWRDPQSEALHLLDFEAQRDSIVARLNGAYVPFILVSPLADVAIGVHLADEPIVVVWETRTGQQHALGLYRQCQRPPDLVSLSNNGTTLVIGCDAGLELWRVVQPQGDVRNG